MNPGCTPRLWAGFELSRLASTFGKHAFIHAESLSLPSSNQTSALSRAPNDGHKYQGIMREFPFSSRFER